MTPMYYARRGCWFAVEIEERRFVACAGDRSAGEVARLDLSQHMGMIPLAELYRRAYTWAHRRGWLRRSWIPARVARWLDRRRAW